MIPNAPVATMTDRSGTVAAGGTSQALMAQNVNRRKIIICNPSTAALQGIAGAESLWFSYTGNAGVGAAGSIEIPAGTTWMDNTPPLGAVTITSTTTAHKFTATEGT